MATGCSLAALLGPIWVVRGSAAVAVLAAVTGCLLAWRELAEARTEHRRELSRTSEAQLRRLRTDRSRNAAVVTALAHRVQVASREIRSGQVVVAQLRGDLARLRTENLALGGEIQRREAAVAELRKALAERDVRTTTDLVADGEAEDVLDPQMIDLALALPNYEHHGRRTA